MTSEVMPADQKSWAETPPMNPPLRYAIGNIVERQTWLDRLAAPFQSWLLKLFGQPGQPNRKIKDYLNGTWLGHPIHPVLTDVPLGAWSGTLILDMAWLGNEDEGVARRHSGRQVADGEGDCEEERVSGDTAHRHAQDHSPGSVPAGVVGLLADVRARIVPGEGPGGEKQADGEGAALPLQQERRRLMGRKERQRADDERHAGHVDPGGEIVEPRHQPDAEVIEPRVRNENENENQNRFRAAGGADHGGDELGQAIIDPCGDGELPDGVEPGGEEPGAAAAEDRRPMIERARSRVRRSQLRQAERDRQREQRDQRPAEGHLQRSAIAQPMAVERDRAGQHRDDRKAQGKICKSSHLAEQLLRVPQPAELLGVPVHRAE